MEAIIRSKQYISNKHDLTAVPTIVTLYENKIQFINNVPIVPISKFALFVNEVYGYLENVRIIK